MKGWPVAVPGLVGLVSAGVALTLWAAAPLAPPKTDEPEPPDDFRTLNLTDLQRRVLEQVFHRHAFEAPPPPTVQARFGVKVEPLAPGGLCRIGPEGDLPARLTVTVGLVGPPRPVRLRYYAEDFYGRKVAEGNLPNVYPDASGLATADLVLKEVSAFGYYHVIVTATVEDPGAAGGPPQGGQAVGEMAAAACGLAVVHAADEGPDTKGPFGLAAPQIGNMEDLPEICRRLGVAHLSFYWDDGRAVALHAAPGKTPASRWEEGEAALKPVLDAGLAATGLVLAEPPYAEASPPSLVAAQAEAVAHYADRVREWHIAPPFGPASLPAGPTGQAVAAYRSTVTGLLDAVRRNVAHPPSGVRAQPGAAGPQVSLAVAATPQDLVDILTEGPVMAGADAVSLWVDADAAAPNLRSGAYRRALDYSLQTARRAGVKNLIVGETGEDPDAQSPQQQAWKLVTRHVVSLAAGAQRVYVAYGRGLPRPLPSAAAYAWMTHLLAGTAYQENLWPDVPLVQAHLFAGAERRVAVVWSWAGEEPAVPDRGALVLDDGSRLDAFDVVGHKVGIWKGERLIVPLGEAPVYIVSADLKADAMRDRLRRARIFGIAPATLWVRQLAPGADPGRMTATLWLQNQRPYRVEVMSGFLLPQGWRSRQTKQQFALDAGQAREVTFDFDVPLGRPGDTVAQAALGPPPSTGPYGPYSLQAVATLNEEPVRRTQAVWPAVVPERTIEVGYGLDDWAGIDPVVVFSAAADVQAEVRVAWDARFFYFAASVRRQRESFRAGRLASEGDAVQLAWGLADRADDDFGDRPRDRAYPAGAFRDTDYLMAITFGKDGAQVVRLRQPRVVLRDHVPGNRDDWYGPVEDAQAEIWRDADKGATVFEAAVPLKALAPLKGERGRTFRFAFRIGDGPRPPLEWARAAGTPDFLAGPGSFLPVSYAEGLPCQTVWMMVGPRPGGPKP
jgi:hypothetical protein